MSKTWLKRTTFIWMELNVEEAIYLSNLTSASLSNETDNMRQMRLGICKSLRDALNETRRS